MRNIIVSVSYRKVQTLVSHNLDSFKELDLYFIVLSFWWIQDDPLPFVNQDKQKNVLRNHDEKESRDMPSSREKIMFKS